VKAAELMATSRELLERSMPKGALPYYREFTRRAEPLATQAETDAAQPKFAAVTEMIEQIKDAASRDAGLAARLIEDIILAIQIVAEPSLLMGILLEGMAETVLERLSEDERRETAIALCTLLWDRINQSATE
jgi:hypothetical protein